ncbi:hypothetical protein [Sinorhizobium meliloti]|uniref:hypothetical protein n=1 Tax=Rhizobium meliloti TaxID=382 RepID=UPI0012956890|nr:hypothetical protein [Sinorhizobium meliloti]MQX28994.1 hypothetical protein [Sinorhizobium meliloti]
MADLDCSGSFLMDAAPYTINFYSANDFIVRFGSDGMIEFGEKYKNSPGEAAKAFIECVLRHWPALKQ